jgi:succinate dehydrogenase hydrophobic anchor subunit
MTGHPPPTPRVSPPTGGVDGNERLTSLVAAVLLLLLFLVGLTVPVASAQTRLHVFLGVVVIPPVLLKVASTSWRFVKYYAGNFSYRRKGPPMLLLRLFGPVLVVVTLVMLFSGVGLVVGAPRSLHPRLSQIHHASFLLWFLVTTVHVLGHLKETLSVASRDFIRGARRRVNGSAMRAWTTLASVAVGIACGWAIVPYVGNVSILSH